MLKFITMRVKSREEIEATLKDIDEWDNYIHATHGKENLEISINLWDVCGQELKVLSTARQSHQYDFSYLYPVDEDGCRHFTYIYFMANWLEEVI